MSTVPRWAARSHMRGGAIGMDGPPAIGRRRRHQRAVDAPSHAHAPWRAHSGKRDRQSRPRGFGDDSSPITLAPARTTRTP